MLYLLIPPMEYKNVIFVI